MHLGRVRQNRRQGINNSIKVFVLDLDQREGFHSRNFVIGGDSGHRLADVEHLVARHDPAVSQRPGAEENIREVLAGNDAPHAGQRLGCRRVYTDNAGMAAGTGQHLAHKHFRQVDVARVGGVAGHLVQSVYANMVLAQNPKITDV